MASPGGKAEGMAVTYVRLALQNNGCGCDEPYTDNEVVYIVIKF
jgi:hypothetical protein